MIDCFSHISTGERARRYLESRSRSNISGAYTCWKTLIKLTFSMERLYRLTEGWYRNISLLPVPRTDSLNSLAEALQMDLFCKPCSFFRSEMWSSAVRIPGRERPLHLQWQPCGVSAAWLARHPPAGHCAADPSQQGGRCHQVGDPPGRGRKLAWRVRWSGMAPWRKCSFQLGQQGPINAQMFVPYTLELKRMH